MAGVTRIRGRGASRSRHCRRFTPERYVPLASVSADYRAGVLVVLDLVDCVLQQRDDGMCREVSRVQLRDEQLGRITSGTDEWWPDTTGQGTTAGRRFVWGLSHDGVPDSVVIGGRPGQIQTAGPFWGCHWEAMTEWEPTEVVFVDRVERFGGRPDYLPDESGDAR